MATKKQTPKEFALAQIAPYFKNHSLCGYDGHGCVYLTENGKMCVAGKNMINPSHWRNSIQSLLNDYTQIELFKPEVVGILTDNEWHHLQGIHDAIALQLDGRLHRRITDFGLFTYQELVEAAEALTE